MSSQTIGIELREEGRATTLLRFEASDGVITFGIDPQQRVQLHTPSASAHHAKLSPGERGWLLSDTSAVGTTRNGTQLGWGEKVVVESGDILRMGEAEVVVRIPAPEALAEPEAPPPPMSEPEPPPAPVAEVIPEPLPESTPEPSPRPAPHRPPDVPPPSPAWWLTEKLNEEVDAIDTLAEPIAEPVAEPVIESVVEAVVAPPPVPIAPAPPPIPVVAEAPRVADPPRVTEPPRTPEPAPPAPDPLQRLLGDFDRDTPAPRVLYYIEGKLAGEFALRDETAEVVVGRSSECHIQVTDPFRIVSKRHGRVYRQWAGTFLEDLSQHGIYVNGEKVQNCVALSHGDRISLSLVEQGTWGPILIYVEGDASADFLEPRVRGEGQGPPPDSSRSFGAFGAISEVGASNSSILAASGMEGATAPAGGVPQASTRPANLMRSNAPSDAPRTNDASDVANDAGPDVAPKKFEEALDAASGAKQSNRARAASKSRSSSDQIFWLAIGAVVVAVLALVLIAIFVF